jgi:hypothetical protein
LCLTLIAGGKLIKVGALHMLVSEAHSFNLGGKTMATQSVVLSTCDRCGTEVHSPLHKKHIRRHELVLPDGWLHVAGNTATSLVFEIDLCDICKVTVLEAAGHAQGRKAIMDGQNRQR